MGDSGKPDNIQTSVKPGGVSLILCLFQLFLHYYGFNVELSDIILTPLIKVVDPNL